MTNLRTAAQQALEALENPQLGKWTEAITALKAALAEPTVPSDCTDSHQQAAELSRLHAELERCKQVSAALLAALQQVEPILARMYGAQAAQLPPMQTVRAAIAKAEENT